MRLWLLRPRDDLPEVRDEHANPWYPWHDKYFGFVIRAETEERAREMAQVDGGDEIGCQWHDIAAWLSPEYSTCTELTADGDEGIVIKDFASA